MKLHDLYESAYKRGIMYDPRGVEGVQQRLKSVYETYMKLSETEKWEHGKESLVNPYSDTRVLYGARDREISDYILVGIDVGCPEILLADMMRKKGKNITLVLSHHPSGKALAKSFDILNMQIDILHLWGVPINIAEGLLSDEIKKLERKIMPANIDRDVNMAEILDIPYLCIHTPANNASTTFLQNYLVKNKPRTLKDIVELLKEIPEIKEALKIHSGPKILTGHEKRRVGKIFVDMTASLGKTKSAYAKLAEAGVGTIIVKSMSQQSISEAKNLHLNIIAAGHIACDNIGLNIILDDILPEDIKVITCSGFWRFNRKNLNKEVEKEYDG